MDTGAAKAIEAIAIGALVFGFYLQQQKALKRSESSEDERNDQRDKAEGSGTAPPEARDRD